MLARTLVSGVRSSWPASWTRRCCWSLERVSAASMEANALDSLPTSSRPPGGTSMSSRPLAAMVSAAALSLVTDWVVRLAMSTPAAAAKAMMTRPTRIERSRTEPGTRQGHDTVGLATERLGPRAGDLVGAVGTSFGAEVDRRGGARGDVDARLVQGQVGRSR